MPCSHRKRYKLRYSPVAVNQQVCRNFEPANLIEIRVRIVVERIGKQCRDFRTTKSSWGQADAVNYNEVRTGIGRPRILIRAMTLFGRFYQPGIGVNSKLRLHELTEATNITMAECQGSSILDHA